MFLHSLFKSLPFPEFSPSCNRRRRMSRTNVISAVECLEDRRMLTMLTVDVNDPAADDPGDNLYAQIQEAVDAAEEGDRIRVKTGVYDPFIVDTDKLTIRAAGNNASPVIDATGIANGIEVTANGISIRGFTVINADQSGFLVTGDSNTFTNNIAIGNVQDGFTFVDSDNNRLTGNTAETNGENGFLLSGDENTLIHNTAVGNGEVGFFVQSGTVFVISTPEEVSNGTTLIRNTAIGNGIDGFEVNGGLKRNPETGNLETFAAVDTRLIHNQASDNSGVGFDLSRLEGATLIGNQSDGNGENGFTIGLTFNSTIVANTATGNGGARAGDGFQIRESNGNFLTANTAEGNTKDGIRLWGSSNNTLLGNRAEGNGGDGFQLEPFAFFTFVFLPSENNTLIGNVAHNNEGAGFRLSGSSNNSLLFNRATDNASDGFRLEGLEIFLGPSVNSNENLLFGNTARDNDGFGFSEAVLDEVFSSPNLYLFNTSKSNALGDFDF